MRILIVYKAKKHHFLYIYILYVFIEIFIYIKFKFLSLNCHKKILKYTIKKNAIQRI